LGGSNSHSASPCQAIPSSVCQILLTAGYSCSRHHSSSCETRWDQNSSKNFPKW
jgi:hypothetical protein